MGRAGISLGQVEAAVRGENASIPGGSVDLGLRKFNLKTSGSYDSLDEIANTVVASRNGRVVRLRDVAEISWDTSEQQYIGRYNGQRAIFVTASAKDRVDVFDVRKAIDGSLDALRGHTAAEREAGAWLRPDAQRQAPARPAWRSTSRSRSGSCCSR